MSLFSGLTKDTSIQEDKDTLGGGVLDSGVYDMTIELAYVNQAESGALGLVIHFKGQNGISFRNTFWVQSGNAKGNKNYWTDQQGNKNYLPGFSQAEAICNLTLDKSLNELEDETKIINVYNAEAKKEIPTKKSVFTELHGQQIKLGLLKQIVDKNEKGNDGKYHPTGETREENNVAKIFDTEGRTITEKNGDKEGEFIKKWSDKFTGTVKDKSKGKTNTGGPVSRANTFQKKDTPTQTLFDD